MDPALARAGYYVANLEAPALAPGSLADVLTDPRVGFIDEVEYLADEERVTLKIVWGKEGMPGGGTVV